MRYRVVFIIIFILNGDFLFAQSDKFYDLENPNFEKQHECNDCQKVLDEMPVEVQFGVANQSNELFFVINDKKYFDLLFKSKTDGIALDIVPRSNYSCSKSASKHIVSKGILYKPLYQKEVLKNTRVDERGIVYVKLADLPEYLNPEEVEYNILFIKKKYLCQYQTFYDLTSHRWDLLEMGLYKDSKSKMVTEKDSIFLSRRLKFIIPFEKNKYDYIKSDIQALYDSLRLIKYNIEGIELSAYSSIEGPTDNNIRLQNKRAESIINAFESFQNQKIPKKITAAENWVEFAEDIRNTKYKFLLQLTKEEIKKRLTEKSLSEELETYLAKHRKAIIYLELEKKNVFKKMGTQQLTSLFNQKIGQKQLAEAQEIQEALFSMMEDVKSPDSIINSLEIPEEVEYADLLLDQVSYKYYQAENIYGTIAQLERLNKLLPNNKRVIYNLTTLKLKSWAYGDVLVDKIELWNEINNLKEIGIPINLINRIKINFKIIECEYLMRERNYQAKNSSLLYIFNNYRKMEVTDDDLLNLAQFFSSYARYDWAISLLDRKVRNVEVNEDLLFYFLNLTIINPSIVSKQFYQTILLNAIDKNQLRYCKMFDTYGYGGITFQLLDNRKLKKFYCQECSR